MENHGFSFIRDSRNEEGKGFSDFVDGGFKRFSGFKWSFGSVGDWSVSGDSSKYGGWFLIQSV